MAAENLDLYFELKPGRKADLEVVAAAAIQWVEAIRIAARQIEPGSNVRVELVDAAEGSLILKTVLDWMENQLAQIEDGAGQHRRLKKLAAALAVFIVFTGIPTGHFYFGDDSVPLDPKDRALIEELLENMRRAPEAEDKARRFFRALERDPAIKGVGLKERQKGTTVVYVPSSEFAERAGLFDAVEDESTRTLYPVHDVVLVSPVLVRTPRSWRFKIEGMPEFTAVMMDRKFLEALEGNHVRETLRFGIPMTVRLEIKEQKVNGEWKIIGSRRVIEVISPRPAD